MHTIILCIVCRLCNSMYTNTVAHMVVLSLLQYPEATTSVSDLLSSLQPLVKVSMKLVHKEVVKMKVCTYRGRGERVAGLDLSVE